MMKLLTTVAVLFLLSSCSNTKKATLNGDVPSCLMLKIKQMTEDSNQGEPMYVTQFNYKGKMVYYVAAACCDKFNMVFDKNCNLLGYPDGGITGKGDGSMPNFRQEATNGKAIWASQKSEETNK